MNILLKIGVASQGTSYWNNKKYEDKTHATSDYITEVTTNPQQSDGYCISTTARRSKNKPTRWKTSE